jgi:hypothetical protein
MPIYESDKLNRIQHLMLERGNALAKIGDS